ncbi:hypothetical protein LguiB_013638 [Lonicera macranthoides]
MVLFSKKDNFYFFQFLTHTEHTSYLEKNKNSSSFPGSSFSGSSPPPHMPPLHLHTTGTLPHYIV